MRNTVTKIRSPLFSGDLFAKNIGARQFNPDYDAVRQTIEGMGKLYDGLSAVRENPNPTDTPAGIALKYKQRFDQATASARKKAIDAAARLDAMQAAADAKMKADTKLGFPSSNAQEVRQVLRSMPDDERVAFLAKSVHSGNAEILSAVMNAPAELSSLAQHTVDHHHELFIQLHASDYLEETEHIDKAQQALELSYEAFLKSAEAMRDPLLESQAGEQVEAFDAADAALKQAMGTI